MQQGGCKHIQCPKSCTHSLAPIQEDILWIVRYLHSIGIDAKPGLIFERRYPSYVRDIPTIEDHIQYILAFTSPTLLPSALILPVVQR